MHDAQSIDHVITNQKWNENVWSQQITARRTHIFYKNNINVICDVIFGITHNVFIQKN